MDNYLQSEGLRYGELMGNSMRARARSRKQ